LVGLLAILVVILAIAIAALVWFNVDGPAAIFAACGALFLLAASGRPATVYLIVRNAGWFAAIPNDRVMRFILLVLGLVFVISSPFFLHLPAAG
jgi:hypothetical protein